MWWKFRRLITPLALLAVLAIIVGGCTLPRSSGLAPVEVSEYQGENLSSVNDFRENSIKGPQHVDIDQYRLKISGLADNPQEYEYNDVITNNNSYEKVVTLNCVEGWSVKILWEGILVKDLLAKAGPLPDAKVIIFHAYDGYTTSFPIESYRLQLENIS